MQTFEDWWGSSALGMTLDRISAESAWNAALTAANERIRKLETATKKLAGVSLNAACIEVDNLLSQLDRIPELIVSSKELTAEREVSDKLVAALKWIGEHESVSARAESYEVRARAALAEVAAIRANRK